MSNKLDYLTKAVFYAHEKPEMLAKVLAGTVQDTATAVSVSGPDTLYVDADDGATGDYTAVVLSQFGDVMTGTTATLALKEAVTGVSIADGTVTVAKTCTAEGFVITATSGSAVAEYPVTLVPANAD